ncbi:MAG: IscS subfamily cysteine desulfurase [Gammaproteobacteria bacterium]|nr:IscS subfamily cysteine desulfurase [Gammaproteobacteria bacterium]NNF61647.1 IscS subfamily cysteine desulfurase [Gammaproteobacteria bacterium]NNM20547.1 IscS subfamily cysteine desulfurase [Gammaproteobacteria bacterium]
MKAPIYMDYAATTPVDPRVAEKMAACLTADGVFANPASDSHVLGRTARGYVESARSQVAQLVGAAARDIVWTSGATESDNLAIKGVAHFYADQGRHIVTSRTEHKAVLDTCGQLEREGFEVTYLIPGADGIIDPQQVSDAVRDDTVLVSIMHVNNEIGVVQDIAAIGALCRQREVTFHVDAAQSAGKLPIDLGSLPVDLMSFSAHKVYGPKGIGALYVCGEPCAHLEPVMHGGGHERGLRSGTLPTHQVVGMGEAFRVAGEELAAEATRLAGLRERLWQGIAALGGVRCNGHPSLRASGLLNVCFEGVEGESLLFALRQVAVSSGSACTSASGDGSYVLRALGLPDYLAQSSIRFSLGRFSTEAEVEYAIGVIREQVMRLRGIAVRH